MKRRSITKIREDIKQLIRRNKRRTFDQDNEQSNVVTSARKSLCGFPNDVKVVHIGARKPLAKSTSVAKIQQPIILKYQQNSKVMQRYIEMTEQFKSDLDPIKKLINQEQDSFELNKTPVLDKLHAKLWNKDKNSKRPWKVSILKDLVETPKIIDKSKPRRYNSTGRGLLK